MSWHHIKQSLSYVALVLMVSFSLGAVFALSQGTKFLSVQSGSMVPAYSKGDLVIANRVPDNGYKVGDVITFINPANSKQTITHRIVALPTPTAMSAGQFITKGDANPTTDTPINGKDIVGKVAFGIPYIGFGFDFVRKPLGLILLIYIPALSIIVSEMKRLMKHYKDQEAYVVAGYDPNQPKAKAIKLSPATKRAAKASALMMIAAVGIAAPVVQAALMSTATLTNSSISTFVPASDVRIYKVVFGNATPTTTNTNTSTSTTTNTSTNISVSNNNPQTATTGNATASGSGAGGGTGNSATSGNASNNSSSNISITVSNGSGSGASPAPGNQPSSQSVVLYNPTSQAINLTGWKLADNGTTQTITSGSVAADSYFAYTWPVSGGLSRINDRLSLSNPSASTVDGVSWGSDTTVLNPPIFTAATSTSLTRKAPALDTNSAADWTVL